jgi:dTDP-glucose 4,6-dehydratase
MRCEVKLQLGNVLVTGGLGFIGSHFIRRMLTAKKYGDINSVINIDFVGYGANLNNLKGFNYPGYRHINANINNREQLESIARTAAEGIDVLVNFAAETHVDRSISNPTAFVDSNVNGVASLLEFCRLHDVGLFVQISTDEVYGDATGGKQFHEDSPLEPNSPYSASKAAADLLTRAYNKTYGLRTVITRCSNNFGPNQFPEKLIPKAIIRTLKGLPIPIYGDGRQIREWIYVNDHIDALLEVITNGKAGDVYNITSSNEFSNIEIVSKIGHILQNSNAAAQGKIEYVQDRPAHDRRYSLDSSKIRKELGWKPAYPFDFALERTIKWYINNDWWWTPLSTNRVSKLNPGR